MGSKHDKSPFGGSFSRRFTGFSGLYFDDFGRESAWIRECGLIRMPPLEGAREIVVVGEWLAHPEATGREKGLPGLTASFAGHGTTSVANGAPGPWTIRLAIPTSVQRRGGVLKLQLTGVGLTNFLAWAARRTKARSLQGYRAQRKNRQLRILRIETDESETVYDFSRRSSPYSSDFARRHAHLGLNVVGFITADLGIGESARAMIRAADAAAIPTSVVALKLNSKNRLGDQTYAARLTDQNPQAITVFHLDPPAAEELDHHHGKDFRKGKYNIGYFAWELPEFPDSWVSSFAYFDEIWCPSNFVREAIAAKSPLPVITMPHSIGFERPRESVAELRSRLGLPQNTFLFLTLFDLNSYAERKNPRASLEAFRRAALRDSALVIKVQNAEGNPAEFAALQTLAASIPGARIISGTFSRAEIYALEAACDCFVSLHRSEGFGFAIAEAMYLGKPVISTDWSAPAEFVTAQNGCPVPAQLVTLETNHGPYGKGSVWAEPDLDAAAAWMSRLKAEPALAARLGAMARLTMDTHYSPEAIGARYRKRLDAIACF